MGNQVYIKLAPETPDAKIDELNVRLKVAKTEFRFTTRRNNEDWLYDINNNPKSPQAHLRPDGRDLTMEELTTIFPFYTEVGAGDVDVAFARCKPTRAKKIIELLAKEPLVASLSSNAEDLFERAREARGGVDENAVRALFLKMGNPYVPELTPKNERMKRPESGIATFKTWGDAECCVLYGNVDMPQWMKDDKYAKPEDNSLYRDSKGRGYLLVPLLALGPTYNHAIEQYYARACDLGLLADFRAFAMLVYNADLADDACKVLIQPANRALSEMDCLAIIRKIAIGHSRNTRSYLTNFESRAGVMRPGKALKGWLKGRSFGQSEIKKLEYVLTTLVHHHGFYSMHAARLMYEEDVFAEAAKMPRTMEHPSCRPENVK